MRRVAALSLGLWMVLSLSAAAEEGGEQPWDMLTAKPEAMQAWQDMRFGMFICWGPVSLTGKEIGWSRGAPTPIEEYDNLYKTWNPEKFDAREWIDVVKQSGARYIVFLLKHHDGFCLWDTKETDYNIMNGAFKRDVTREIADACHEKGIGFFPYYSVCDWHHPDFPLTSPGGRTKREVSNLERYTEYLEAQVKELITNYGPLLGIWFDVPQCFDRARGERVIRFVRTLQPDILVNNRTGAPGDFDTPEQRLGSFRLDRPWETCMTLGTQWAWKPDDKIKSLKECIDVLVTCAGRNGNLALNTNPMPDGRIEPRQVERFLEIGQWLKQYGETIYGTRGGPFWGLGCMCTRKDKTIYVHVLKWYDDRVVLPAISKKVVSHEVLTGGTATLTATDEGLEITVPPEHRQELDTIIALHLDGPAADLPQAQILHSDPLTFGKKVTTSHVYDANPEAAGQYSPEKAVDGDPRSGWTFNPGIQSAWLEVDLGKPYTFDRAWLNEPYDRIQKFELQAKQGDQWETFHSGTTIGEDFLVKFPPVTAQYVRLQVLETTINPLVGEFQLFRVSKRSQ